MKNQEQQWIELDGSTGEGGGQILRTALALSMCTGQPFVLRNIRARRAKPGLMRQHLTCVLAAQEVCDAQVQGAELNASTLHFEPGAVQAGDYRFSVGSAGSCTLVLQTVWPALMQAAAPSTVLLSGGTHNPMAPPAHFLQRSYMPLLARLGAHCTLTLRRMGFYPAGGGEVEVTIAPAGALQPFDLLARGERQEAYAECLAPALPRNVAHRELEAVGQAMGWAQEQLRQPVVRANEGPGNALMLTLAHEHVTEVFTEFGSKGISAEEVATRVVQQARHYLASTAALGPYLADQWALPLALAVRHSGQAAAYTCTELTPHAHSNMGVIQQFLPLRFDTQAAEGGWLVRCLPGA
ncbi:MAG: RNA 3'-terminal phosphate cyclase [Ideonella sp. MAG2]|nr:MAG: RNA 3'-terminal phosphate cyclase [Ideonella sp. MAG2]